MFSMAPLSFTSAIRLKPAYAAALALVGIQVSIGILFKAAQTGGQYSFSASASVTISEFLKLLLSTTLFYRECIKRQQDASQNRGAVWPEPNSEDEEKQASQEDGENQAFLKSTSIVDNIGRLGSRYSELGLRTFSRYVMDELPVETRYGFAQLALFYVLINNTLFVLYKLADPGTIQLIKSGTTLITAVVSMFLLGTKVVPGQWIAITLQVCGIVITQYRPGTGAAFPLSTYLILLFQTTLSAVSSVYNQKLCKSVEGSLHVMNMSLYGAGACINFVLHIIVRIIKPDEPGFFTGFGNWGAIMVILSNVFIGLAMTAVYKYADAIIKCFATAISTAILLYLSPILFGIDFSFLVLPGTVVVFIATWLYMEATPPRSPPTTTSEPRTADLGSLSLPAKLLYALSPKGRLRRAGLGIATALALLIISNLTASDTRSSIPKTEPAPGHNITGPTIESPFKNTMAYVRWNSKHPERIPLIEQGYAPFFHTVHYSMPFIAGNSTSFVNLTHDSFNDAYWAYRAVKDTMQVVLDEPNSTIDGMLFFHFDAWISPMEFADMDFNKVWFPDSPEPKYLCMKDKKRYDEWWGWGVGFHEKALQAVRLTSNMRPDYTVDPDEWCVGWSDIYYIPRRFFRDFIELSDIFLAVPVFHEIAIPTMLNIIDRTYRPLPSRSVIAPIGDCWGTCCTSNPSVEDIAWKRCGHRLDYVNEEVTASHYSRLTADALLLNTALEEDSAGPLGADLVNVTPAKAQSRR